MDYYWIYQKCEDYFETADAKKLNQILFAALFLFRLIS